MTAAHGQASTAPRCSEPGAGRPELERCAFAAPAHARRARSWRRPGRQALDLPAVRHPRQLLRPGRRLDPQASGKVVALAAQPRPGLHAGPAGVPPPDRSPCSRRTRAPPPAAKRSQRLPASAARSAPPKRSSPRRRAGPNRSARRLLRWSRRRRGSRLAAAGRGGRLSRSSLPAARHALSRRLRPTTPASTTSSTAGRPARRRVSTAAALAHAIAGLRRSIATRCCAPASTWPPTASRRSWSGGPPTRRRSRSRASTLRALPTGAPEAAALAALVAGEKRRPFDLARPPQLRFSLCALGAGRWQLRWSHHHAVLDGWSVATMLAEIAAGYLALLRGEPAPGAPRAQRPQITAQPQARLRRLHIALERARRSPARRRTSATGARALARPPADGGAAGRAGAPAAALAGGARLHEMVLERPATVARRCGAARGGGAGAVQERAAGGAPQGGGLSTLSGRRRRGHRPGRHHGRPEAPAATCALGLFPQHRAAARLAARQRHLAGARPAGARRRARRLFQAVAALLQGRHPRPRPGNPAPVQRRLQLRPFPPPRRGDGGERSGGDRAARLRRN